MKWHFEKFIGDGAIYAICPKCGFYHNASVYHNGQFIIAKQYNYCPMCGEYLYVASNNIGVVWNERDIDELQKEN